MPFARVNGVMTSYEDRGSGLPVLFIHGGYGGAATTLAPPREVIREVLPEDRFRLVTYDRRCRGQTEYVDGDYDLEDLADDAAALLDHLGIGSAVIIGSSAGGPIALQFALSRPERTTALALPNTGANLMDQSREVSRQRLALVERFRSEGARAVFESRKHRLREAPAAEAQAGEPGTEERRAALQAALEALSDEELFRYSSGEIRNFAAYVGFDFAPRLAELKMPVCVIHGTADQTVPFAWGKALHEGIPGSEFHAIEGGRHGILGHPEAAAALRSWAERIAAEVPARSAP
ncbi:MAG TPA: alpha/beta hydrolase [Dehalococcoidia bacterium]|nr:alpha/beta hydrolase [Dehalococcoidia bacterium]